MPMQPARMGRPRRAPPPPLAKAPTAASRPSCAKNLCRCGRYQRPACHRCAVTGYTSWQA
jgi:hypothetical protein